MGMSASQVRFLTLQNRKSSVGLQLGNLSMRKRSLNRELTRIANEYNSSFSETKLQWYDTINASYTDITYSNLMTPGVGNSYSPYLLSDRTSGAIILDSITPTTTTSMHGYSGVGASMDAHMERITGVSSENYIPASMSYNSDIQNYIIEDIIGVNGFNRHLMKYTPVENTEIYSPGSTFKKASAFIQENLVDINLSSISEIIPKFGEDNYYTKGNIDVNPTLNTETRWAALYENSAVVWLAMGHQSLDELRNTSKNRIREIINGFVTDLFTIESIKNMDGVSGANLTTLKNNIINSSLNAICANYNGQDYMFNDHNLNVDTNIAYNSDGKHHSNQIDDPLQSSASDNVSGKKAAAMQADYTIAPVAVQRSDNKYDAYFSIANMMDVVMYYLGLYTNPDSNVDNLYTNENLEGMPSASHSSDSLFTPSSYSNRANLYVKEKGLMQAPSLYSINSNLQMLDNLLKHRLEHDSSFGNSYTQWDPNNSSTNTINSILTYVNNFINGSDNLTTHDVVILANVNAWLTDAMKATTASEFKTALNNAKDMLSFKDSVTLDENGEVISGLSEKDGWNSANNAKPNAFYYDSGKDFDERTYSLSQSFDVSFATSSQDLESQLIGEELQKLNFYKKLVIACLENGWQGNESVNDKEYLNATLANTKWLISGVAAKDSSRIFEVKNEELREEALSEYEAKHELISQKAERVDLQMETLKTEQNAINTEMDSLKRTIDDNIKRVFSANG